LIISLEYKIPGKRLFFARFTLIVTNELAKIDKMCKAICAVLFVAVFTWRKRAAEKEN
jgi:hypothetical protein